MVHKKSSTKRCSFKDKYKVRKKVKEHKRKMKKLARNNPQRLRHKKDPGVPNLWPYKEALLNRMGEAKQRAEEMAQRQKKDRRELLMKRRLERSEAKEQASTQSHTTQAQQNQKKWFMKDLKQLLEVSDVVLEVLDARDPLGCRCKKIEEMIQGQYSTTTSRTKRIVLVLNKIDLVPQEVVTQWVKYLRREFPCVAFKASTQQQRGNLSEMKIKVGEASQEALQSGRSVGGQALLQLIKNYSRSHDIKTSITVGVIGFPNVGKSSLINSLKRARAVGVGAQPGFTKQCQLVKLDKQVSIIDSPGVLFDADTSDPGLSLRNCLKIESIEDPVGAVKEIVKRCGKKTLLGLYRIADFSNGDEFLYRVAQKRGKLSKGGIPDMPAAARCVLRDWNAGKIPFYTLPPQNESSEHESVSLVKGFGEAFDLNKMNEVAIREGASQSHRPASFMALESKPEPSVSKVAFVGSAPQECDEKMDEGDGTESQRLNRSARAKNSGRKESMIDTGINPQSNKALRQQQKKNKKKAKKSKMGGDEAYTFDDNMWT